MTTQTRPRAPFLAGPTGDVVALVWGFAEATLFFIVPDVFLTAGAAFWPRRSLRQIALVIAGSIVGGIAMFLWADNRLEQARTAVSAVPFVNADMPSRVNADFRDHGVWALCRGPASGIPYKVYAVEAPKWTTLPLFAAVSVPARAERLLITWGQFAIAGWAARRALRRPIPWLLAFHAVYWIAVYLWYWRRA